MSSDAVAELIYHYMVPADAAQAYVDHGENIRELPVFHSLSLERAVFEAEQTHSLAKARVEEKAQNALYRHEGQYSMDSLAEVKAQKPISLSQKIPNPSVHPLIIHYDIQAFQSFNAATYQMLHGPRKDRYEEALIPEGITSQMRLAYIGESSVYGARKTMKKQFIDEILDTALDSSSQNYHDCLKNDSWIEEATRTINEKEGLPGGVVFTPNISLTSWSRTMRAMTRQEYQMVSSSFANTFLDSSNILRTEANLREGTKSYERWQQRILISEKRRYGSHEDAIDARLKRRPFLREGMRAQQESGVDLDVEHRMYTNEKILSILQTTARDESVKECPYIP